MPEEKKNTDYKNSEKRLEGKKVDRRPEKISHLRPSLSQEAASQVRSSNSAHTTSQSAASDKCKLGRTLNIFSFISC